MNLNVYISFEEMVDFLRKKGYTVGKRTERMSWSVYHNDVETENVEVWYVQKNGQDFREPCGMNYEANRWVEDVFNLEIQDRLKKFVLSL